MKGSEEYEIKLRQSLESARQHKIALKQKRGNELNSLGKWDSDEYFAVIIGYSSGGAPYGLTHEEMAEIEPGEILNNIPEK